MYKSITRCIVSITLGFFILGSTHAATVSVSQETSPGSGSFTPLGTIQSFSTSGTLAGFYMYATQQFSNTDAVTLTADQSHLFIVDASDGLGLFVVHDDGKSLGGNAENRVDLLGGDTASFLLYDDPFPSDNYLDTGTLFEAEQSWTQNFTDGYVIGTLDGDWTVDVQFTEVGSTAIVPIRGLSSWAALSSDGSGGQTEIALVLEEDRRVRLNFSDSGGPDPIPVPPAIWLFGSGLLGLVGAARRKRST
jgi:hypothetical protein